MALALIDSVLHWRRKLEKDPDDDYILNVIRKLSKVPITLEILETTHIGKTIRKLSKRDDPVGEKAKTVLNKWRDVFTHQGSDKKENLNKESKSSTKHEKSVHSQKQPSHHRESKHKNSPKKVVNGSCKANNLSESSHSLYKSDVKQRNSNYMDYDPHTESSEGYNPECPELFPSQKPIKTKKPVFVETYEPSSVKRKLTDEKEQNGEKSHHKKMKTSSHSNSVNISELKKSSEKKDKRSLNKEKYKDNSHSSTLKRESTTVKMHSESAKKHESVSDTKKKNKVSPENDKTKSKTSKVKMLSAEEFTSSEVSFEDCLGFNDIVSMRKSSKSFSSAKKQSSSAIPSKEKPTEKSKKVSSKTESSHQKTVSKNSSSNANVGKVSKDSSLKMQSKVSKDSFHSNKEIPFTVPKPSTKLDVADIASTLPEIQPNYIPLPRSPEFYTKKKALSNEQAILFTTSKREKTAVYSGRKTGLVEVPTLFQACMSVLMENIDAIECLGNATFEMMLPLLEKCTPRQLYNIENYNPSFIANTGDLWQNHCKANFKLETPSEHETWRELYWRAFDERELRLKNVTASINKSMSTSTPTRQVKLAYIDSYVKPPRDIIRQQAKHGTAGPVTTVTAKKPNARPSTSSTSSSTSSSSSAPKKPKIAPLMAKTLKSLKAFRRK